MAAWPSLGLMLVLTAIPFAVTMALSLTDYDLIKSSEWQFVGLQNFERIARNDETWTILLNTAYLVIGATVIEVVLGLALAMLMDSTIRGIGIIRTLYFIPIMTVPIVAAVMWRAMFNHQAGWINYFLGLLHLPEPVWLGDKLLAMPAIIITDLWSGVPLVAIILLAGLLAVPKELKEAAMVDGASSWQVFRNVTLQFIRPVLFVVVVLRFMDLFRKFEGIQQVTNGGPAYATTTLNVQMYELGLHYTQVGLAAAYGVVTVVVIALSVGAFYLIAGRR